MIEVNTLDLVSTINKFDNLINNYEEIKLNLFNQLEEACNDLRGQQTSPLSEKIYEDRKETDLLLQNLREYKDVYSYIYNQYSNIGKTIICKLDNKDKLNEIIRSCEEQLVEIINGLNAIDNSFEYPEYNEIQNQKQKAITIQKNLNQAQTTINETFNKINTIENGIKVRMTNLEEININ